jgi:chemotaxis protein CheD
VTELNVAIARHGVVRAPGRLVCVGVGSCVVITLHDAASGTGALAHVLLPEELPGAAASTGHPARYATTAVPLLVGALKARGAAGPYTAKLAGGATLFPELRPAQGRVGPRNVDAARKALAAAGIDVAAEDTGGTVGRSVVFDVATGKVAVRLAGGDTRVI